MSDTPDIIAATRGLFDAFTQHDLDRVMAHFTESSCFCGNDGTEAIGLDAIRSVYTQFLPLVIRYTEIDSFADPAVGKVVAEWECHLDINGQALFWEGVDVIHWVDGKIVLKSTYAKTESPLLMSDDLPPE